MKRKTAGEGKNGVEVMRHVKAGENCERYRAWSEVRKVNTPTAGNPIIFASRAWLLRFTK